MCAEAEAEWDGSYFFNVYQKQPRNAAPQRSGPCALLPQDRRVDEPVCAGVGRREA
jgi:hypothetical protein